MKKSNKILAVVLALVMMLTAVPMMTAGAADEHKHVYEQQGATVEPTCTTEGKTTFKCDCGDVKEIVVKANGHKLVGSFTKKDDKVHTRYCDTCKKQIELEHEFTVDVEVTKNPTCTESGTKKVKCANCDATKEVVVEAKGHDYTGNAVVAIEGGKHDGICNVCKETKSEAHKWDKGVKVSSGKCKEDGVIKYTCEVCDAKKEEKLAATCTYPENGTTVDAKEHSYKCSVCGDVKKEAHEFEAKVIKEADCTIEGTLKVTCTKCDYAKEEKIAAAQHKFNKYEKYILATHKATCEKCDDTVIEPHTWDEGKETVAPTCYKEGTKTFTCVCGQTKTEKIDKVAHTWGEWTVTKEATYTEEGVKEHVCTVKDCGAKETEKIEKLKELAGDVNGNGKIEAVDARMILQHVAKIRELSEAEAKRADVVGNGDGVKATDARKVLQIVAGL